MRTLSWIQILLVVQLLAAGCSGSSENGDVDAGTDAGTDGGKDAGDEGQGGDDAGIPDGGDAADAGDTDPGPSWAVLPDTTKGLSEETVGLLAEVSEEKDFLLFAGTNEELAALERDDVIVIGVSEHTPNGLLRKVTSAFEVDGQVEVTTTDASLADAIQDGHLETSSTLDTADIRRTKARTGVSVNKDLRRPGVMALELDNVTLVDGVTVNGEVSFEMDLDFVLDFGFFKVDHLRLVTITGFHSDLQFLTESDLTIDEKVEIISWEFVPIVIFVGIPVVIVPELGLYVGADGEISVGIEAGVQQDATLEAGVEYDGDWHKVNEYTSDFEFLTPGLSDGARLRGFLGPQLNLLIYDVIGPYANISGYLELLAQQGSQDVCWELRAGLMFGMGVVFEMLDIEIATWGRPDIIDYSRKLASGCGDDNHNWSVESLNVMSDSHVAGAKLSLALDPQDRPHIVYVDLLEDSLKLVHFDGALWSTEVVDGYASTGAQPSLVIDDAGTLHLSHCGKDAEWITGLKYTSGTPGALETVIVAAGVGGGVNTKRTSLALDSDGRPHIAYQNSTGDTLDYARLTDSGWIVETVDDVADRYPSLALDGQDRPIIAHSNGYGYLLVTSHDGLAWSTEQVEDIPRLDGDISLALAGDDTPHIGCHTYFGQDLYHVTKVDGAWVVDRVDTGARFGHYNSIRVTPAGVAHIAFDHYEEGDLRYTHWQGAGWSVEVVDAPGNVGKWTSLVLDSANKPHIAYYDDTLYYLKYARWTGD